MYITFLPWSSAFGVGYRDLPLYIFIKDSFFITCNNNFEQCAISLPWKKSCHNEYVIILILLRVWRDQTASLLTFISWIMDCDVLRWSTNSLVLFCRLHFTSFLTECWSRSDECLGLGSSLNDVLPEQGFKNQFRIWQSLMSLWL